MANPSVTTYDYLLKTVDHYRSFPAMMPFIGGDYESPLHKRLLLIGESNYFPQNSTIHKDSAGWYNTEQKSLTDTEVEYIHCRKLLEGPWKRKTGHKMYININLCLEDVGLIASERSISHIAYMNAFQRPASETGKSFKHCYTDIDLDLKVSVDVIDKVMSIIKPEIVVFVSKYAWDALHSRINKSDSGVYFDYVSHPADHFHWQTEYPHGKSKFINILKTKFLV